MGGQPGGAGPEPSGRLVAPYRQNRQQHRVKTLTRKGKVPEETLLCPLQGSRTFTLWVFIAESCMFFRIRSDQLEFETGSAYHSEARHRRGAGGKPREARAPHGRSFGFGGSGLGFGAWLVTVRVWG